MFFIGVILTLPEYRLSFQLKMYEQAYKGEIDIAKQFLIVHKWMNSNIRNILDESDAILHAKYQIVYTIGEPTPLDGDEKRWNVTQAVLKRIPHHMEYLYEKYKEDKIEFNQKHSKGGHFDVFTPCRILDESVYVELKECLIEDFLTGRLKLLFPETSASVAKNLKRLLSDKEIDAKLFHSTMGNFTTIEQNIILILSGLLRFEVLKLALMRRYRVNYGVNEKGHRKMAVPFRAKDVAAEMTEFGHPDVAICLTQLSYYYSGLISISEFQF